MDTTEIARKALELRSTAQYTEADKLFALAYYYSEGVQLADILFNWADNRRRISKDERPSRLQEAEDMTCEALGILEPIKDEYMKQYAACLHHLGRLERQVGSYVQALILVEQSIWRIRVCNQEMDIPYIDTLTTLLDAASTRAICGFPWRARLAALQALVWTSRGMTESAEPTHRKRALALFVFANWPHSRFGFVRRAFFGREVMNSE